MYDMNEARWTLNKAVKYESCLDFVTKTNSETSKSLSRLLFLRGFPSAEWLGVIGARYRIDSEFFMRFLHFKPARDTTPNYSLPALPAATWNILEFLIVTIGERKVLPGLVDQSTINTMRKEAGLQLQVHHDLLRGNDGVAVASSVVRDISIIDHSCFALEQCIWICLQPLLIKDSDGGRWTLVVWTDAGRTTSVKSILDLNVLPKEFQTEAISLLPVIDYKPSTALAAQRYTSLGHVYPIKGAEAASQLCDGYGRTLHEDVMASDPLYALTEVFNVTTASVNQFLNLIEHKLSGFTDDEHYDDFDMLSNLRYSKDVLYRQQRQLEQVSAWPKLHQLLGGIGWRTTSTEDPKASQAAKSILQRYEYLQTRVQKLQAQCQDAISNLMNNINLKEVRNSYEQSKRIGKLTFLAFLFAPLSFTTSFFAMNIGLQNLTLKTWLAVTIGLLSITFFLVVVNFSGWIKLLQNKMHHATKKARYL
ncbi:Mg2+ transporter protein, CorA-like/Zinc transport protein ZntB, partial [Metarhizium brunneum ARSEF 3297]